MVSQDLKLRINNSIELSFSTYFRAIYNLSIFQYIHIALLFSTYFRAVYMLSKFQQIVL